MKTKLNYLFFVFIILITSVTFADKPLPTYTLDDSTQLKLLNDYTVEITKLENQYYIYSDKELTQFLMPLNKKAKFGFTEAGNYTITGVKDVQGSMFILDYVPCYVSTGIIINNVLQYKESLCPFGIKEDFRMPSFLNYTFNKDTELLTVFFDVNHDPTIETDFEGGVFDGWDVYNNTYQADCVTVNYTMYKSEVWDTTDNNVFGDFTIDAGMSTNCTGGYCLALGINTQSYESCVRVNSINKSFTVNTTSDVSFLFDIGVTTNSAGFDSNISVRNTSDDNVVLVLTNIANFEFNDSLFAYEFQYGELEAGNYVAELIYLVIEGNQFVKGFGFADNLIINITETAAQTDTISIATDSEEGIDSDNLGGYDFNTTNLEEIETAQINLTVTAENGMSDWYFNFTAGGTKGCSIGNKQSSTCYYKGNVNEWILYQNSTDGTTFDATNAATGDGITVSRSGETFTITMDEHYNPNVCKHYEALYNFSDIKWQSGVNQRITQNNLIYLGIENVNIPLDADQYKLDFRVNYTVGVQTPIFPLQAYLCNSSYEDGNPETSAECVFIVEKLPGELQDDGTKFRGIFTKNLIDTIGNINSVILRTDENNPNKYYFIKTFGATAIGYNQKWNYSNDNGVTYSDLADGYESEFNINWFFDGPNETVLVYRFWANTTSGNVTFAEDNITWEVEPTNNYPPLVAIITPATNTSVQQTMTTTFTGADPNDDNINMTLSLYRHGILNTTLATNMNQSNTSFETTVSVLGLFNLTMVACELGTTDLFCRNDTHAINITPNIPPTITIDSFTCTVDSNVTLDLDWTYTGNLSFFELYNYTVGNYTLLYNNTGLNFTHTLLLPNTTYLYNLTSYYNSTILDIELVNCTTEINVAPAVNVTRRIYTNEELTEEVTMIGIAVLIIGMMFWFIYTAKTINTRNDEGKAVALNTFVVTILYALAGFLAFFSAGLAFAFANEFGLSASMIQALNSQMTLISWGAIIAVFLIFIGVSINAATSGLNWIRDKLTR